MNMTPALFHVARSIHQREMGLAERIRLIRDALGNVAQLATLSGRQSGPAQPLLIFGPADFV